MKPIVLIDHADGVSGDADWIARTLRPPETVEPDPDHPERVRAHRSLAECDGRVLRVMYEDTHADIQVITAFPDRYRTRRLTR